MSIKDGFKFAVGYTLGMATLKVVLERTVKVLEKKAGELKSND